MKSNIEKDSCEDKMASCEAENGNNVNDKGTEKTEDNKASKPCKQIQPTSNINIINDSITGLPQHNRDKFIKFSSTGILNHYGPTFRNIKKDLERLNIRQEVLSVDISTETAKLRTLKLRERACKLQELKQSEALEKEAKRAQQLAREKALIAKNDS